MNEFFVEALVPIPSSSRLVWIKNHMNTIGIAWRIVDDKGQEVGIYDNIVTANEVRSVLIDEETDWEVTDMRTVKWNEEQTRYLLERLGKLGEKD